ncbi:MAG: hypothetical protein RI967_2203 [Planctomycetota bacterium]
MIAPLGVTALAPIPLVPTTLALTWVAPLAGGILAASILAPLVALWFLKLKRRRRAVPSTLLWTRSLADLRANAPFQRIRFSWLLVLQILAVVAIALALAQPEAEGLGSAGGRHVILLDRSGSMGALESVDGDGRALDPPRSRLDLARDAAKARVRELLDGGWFSTTASDVMVVAFGARAEVRAPFTSSIATLEKAIDGIEPSDESTGFAEAIELARAFASSRNVGDERGEQREIDPGEAPALELYSDGRIADLDKVALRAGERIVYHRVGTTPRNLAIDAVSADRPPDGIERIQVFASVVNPQDSAASATLEMSVDGVVRAVTPEPVEIPAASEVGGVWSPGRAQVVFRPFEQPADAVIEVSIVAPPAGSDGAAERSDALPADDRAAIVVPPAKPLAVLHAGGDGFVVRTLLDGLPLERIVHVTADEYAAMVTDGRAAAYDVTVLDGFAPERLAPGRYLVLGATPPLEGLTEYGKQEGVYARIVRDEHPVFRAASLDDLFVSSMRAVQADRGFEILAEAAEGPLVLAYDRAGLHVLTVTFDPLDSNWPLQRSFVHFMANAIEHLGRVGEAVAGRAVAPGGAITVTLPAGSRDAVLVTPGGAETPLAVDASGAASWGPARVAGLYEVRYLAPGATARDARTIAVNMTDALESRIAPRESLDLGTANVQGVAVASTSRRGALWPWVLAAGLAIILFEWWYYQRQVRL